jgi:hypothetical protein
MQEKVPKEHNDIQVMLSTEISNYIGTGTHFIYDEFFHELSETKLLVNK